MMHSGNSFNGWKAGFQNLSMARARSSDIYVHPTILAAIAFNLPSTPNAPPLRMTIGAWSNPKDNISYAAELATPHYLHHGIFTKRT